MRNVDFRGERGGRIERGLSNVDVEKTKRINWIDGVSNGKVMNRTKGKRTLFDNISKTG